MNEALLLVSSQAFLVGNLCMAVLAKTTDPGDGSRLVTWVIGSSFLAMAVGLVGVGRGVLA